VLRDWRARLAAGALLGGGALGGTWLACPGCISGPYGAMDPFLLHAFLPYIDEANSVFQQRPARLFALGGPLALACLVSIRMMLAERRRWAELLPLAAVVLASGLVMLAQLRGVYIGAPLAAPMLAILVVGARRRGKPLLVVAAWVAGAGILYATLADQLETRFPVARGGEAAETSNTPRAYVLCSAGDAWQQVDRAPPGVIMAGTNVAAYVIGATRHSTVGAGYHRNNAGNMAMYRFFLGTPDQARSIGREWKARYVLFCPGDFDEIQIERAFPASLAAQLRSGRAPAWLEPLPLNDTPLRFYRIR
jgi:hypothetical protein